MLRAVFNPSRGFACTIGSIAPCISPERGVKTGRLVAWTGMRCFGSQRQGSATAGNERAERFLAGTTPVQLAKVLGRSDGQLAWHYSRGSETSRLP